MNTSTPRPGNRIKFIVAGVVLILGVQVWGVIRNTGRVRAVIYNQGRGLMEDVTLVCGNETVVVGTLVDQSSRYVWFHPQENPVIVMATWNAADGHHENGWATERGERLTVRIVAGDAPTVSRERSLGRRLMDELESQ